MNKGFILALALAACAAPRAATLAPEEATHHVGETVSLEYTVAQVGLTRSIVFLNSKPFRPGNADFVAVIFDKVRPQFEKAFGGDLRAALEGKRVRVSGQVKLYERKARSESDGDQIAASSVPEMVLESPEQLALVP
jgi:hypothetical protein